MPMVGGLKRTGVFNVRVELLDEAPTVTDRRRQRTPQAANATSTVARRQSPMVAQGAALPPAASHFPSDTSQLSALIVAAHPQRRTDTYHHRPSTPTIVLLPPSVARTHTAYRRPPPHEHPPAPFSTLLRPVPPAIHPPQHGHRRLLVSPLAHRHLCLSAHQPHDSDCLGAADQKNNTRDTMISLRCFSVRVQQLWATLAKSTRHGTAAAELRWLRRMTWAGRADGEDGIPYTTRRPGRCHRVGERAHMLPMSRGWRCVTFPFPPGVPR